jgi:pyruvate dehydrogenase E1 component
VPEQVARWAPAGFWPLGTDGFGRSEARRELRRFFEVDAECIALAALAQLAARDQFDRHKLVRAVKQLDLDPDKADPMVS